MIALAWSAIGLWLYCYVGYPAALRILAAIRAKPARGADQPQWPMVGITIPAYNEARSIAETLEAVLACEYPAARRQIVVISDASTDGTDEIVTTFASRGVELVRQPVRRGKTAAENAARAVLRAEIVVNTDASVRVHRQSIRQLVRAFEDPLVGVASSRDVSVARMTVASNAGESAYVGYEMWVRGLETTVSGIVGASGSLFAIRTHLHQEFLPEGLSRDFAAALVARLRGYRAVSVAEAICFVPRGASLRQEYRRKVRTMARGLATLWYFRRLLDPVRYGLFAWMLASHKLARWVLPWATAALAVAIAVLARDAWPARGLLAVGLALGALGALGWFWPEDRAMPRAVSLPAFTLAGILAGMHAWLRLLAGRQTAVWEPTRRQSAPTGESTAARS
jgi:cellulose synthase/poly-beta-1,6-N-acetylglucosamine synthase-like glycosyltransferase